MPDGLDAIIHRKEPSRLDLFLAHPHRYIADTLSGFNPVSKSSHSNELQGTSNKDKLKVVCISDTHNNQFLDLPDGDILIHAGDLTERGTLDEVQKTVDWLDTLPHKIKIAIAGNHELCLDPNHKGKSGIIPRPDLVNWKSLHYLNDSSVVLNLLGQTRPIKIYGNPSTPRHGNSAFQYPRSEDYWRNRIPDDVDILVSHGPPQHHLDIHVGCASLLREVWRTRPKLHVCGHIHVSRGKKVLEYDNLQKYYERLSSGDNIFWNVCLLLGCLLIKYLYKLVGIESKNGITILVNATMVKGNKNEPVSDPATVVVVQV